jgi:hypothetical protein
MSETSVFAIRAWQWAEDHWEKAPRPVDMIHEAVLASIHSALEAFRVSLFEAGKPSASSTSDEPPGALFIRVKEHDRLIEVERRRIQSLERELERARANTVSAASMRTAFEPGTLEAGAPVVIGHDGWVEWQGKRFVLDKDGMVDRMLKAEEELARLREKTSTDDALSMALDNQLRITIGARNGETLDEAVKRFTADAAAVRISLGAKMGEEIVDAAKRCRDAIGARADETTIEACQRAKIDIEEWGRRFHDAYLILAGGKVGR